MTRLIRSAIVALLVTGGLCLGAAPASAQVPPEKRPPLNGNQGRQGGRQGGQALAPGQADLSALSVQQMFDAMAVLEAERFLPLTPEQYPAFVQRLRRLQEARTQFNRQRLGFMNELRRMTQPNATPNVDDAAIDLKVKDLERFDTEGRQAIRRAFDELDGILTPRQRARFRILEDNLEKKKLDFIARARQGGPGGPGLHIP